MPYTKTKRPYKHEYEKQKERKEAPDRAERQRARRKKKCPEGQDTSHKKALSKGGSNKDGVTCEPPSKNRARNYKKKKGGKK
jgi:hypothetical protein|tara:strand:- start:5042 stop:5287 length:246 start_codon:yes stop_codon:yes gene_type:complete